MIELQSSHEEKIWSEQAAAIAGALIDRQIYHNEKSFAVIDAANIACDYADRMIGEFRSRTKKPNKEGGGMKNAAIIWDSMCRELVATDRDGHDHYRLTSFGIVAKVHGLPTSEYQVCNIVGNRESVAAFLRDFATAIEKGE